MNKKPDYKIKLEGRLSRGWGENDFAVAINELIVRPKHIYYDDGDAEPIAEVFEDLIANKFVTICYFLTKKKKSWDEAQRDRIYFVMGNVEAEYQDKYSEYTGYLWTDEELKVGGHDLLKELENFNNYYLLMEIKVYIDGL